MANHMKSRYSGLKGDFSLQLAEFAKSATEAIDSSIREIIIEVGSSVIRMSAVDTGRFRANWQFSLSTPDNTTTENVDKTGAEALARLVATANTFTAGQVAYITNSLPYSLPLEYGHSAQSPQGMVRVTLARFQQIVNEAVRSNQI